MARKYSKLSQILKKLLFEKNMRPIDLARELDMPSPTIHRIVTGKSARPFKSSLEAISTYLGVSIDQLIGDEPLLPDNLSEVSGLVISKSYKAIPLLTFEQIELPRPIKSEVELLTVNVSDEAFALIMPDYSMEPLFKKDSTLIFDPELPIEDRNYVLVKLGNCRIYVIRQILIDGNNKFIKPINPDFGSAGIKKLNQEDKIVARLVEVRNKF